METGDSNISSQITIAETARIARRDYIENLHLGRVSDWHRMLNQTELDQLALENEHTFISCFGFDAGPTCRRQVINIKLQAELTTREIRLLKRTGTLRLRSVGARLEPSRIIECIGWLQIAMFVSYFLTLLIISMGPHQASLKRLIIQGLLACAMVVLAGFYHWIYIKPSNIARRALKLMEA